MENISRRKFLRNSAEGAAFITAGAMTPSSLLAGSLKPDSVPCRLLGKTGLEVSILSFGGGSQFQMNKNGEWEKLLEEAVSCGVNLFDTASSYSEFKKSEDDLSSEDHD